MKYQKSPNYSFGYRRKIAGESPLQPLVSTKPNLGPGKYNTNINVTSKFKAHNRISFPKNQKLMPDVKNICNNETYDLRSSFGKQLISNKKNELCFKIGKGSRDKYNGFKYDKNRPQLSRLNIPMPKI